MIVGGKCQGCFTRFDYVLTTHEDGAPEVYPQHGGIAYCGGHLCGACAQRVANLLAPQPVDREDMFEDVMRAMQPAEELSGPDSAQYVALMERIAHEAQRRANNARQREWAVTFNRGHVGVTQIVAARSREEAEAVFRERMRSSGEIDPSVVVIEVRS